jgi:mono/diheme cytochrome c family protein
VQEAKEEEVVTHLKGTDRDLYLRGKELYERDGYCITCHQADGHGLEPSGFPPLSGTEWVMGSPDRLIKLTIHGMLGPIEIKGKTYPGNVPMTPFGGLMNDEEIAAVLTYVRNSFTNRASVITADKVRKVRIETEDKKGFYRAEDLLAQHPKQMVN